MTSGDTYVFYLTNHNYYEDNNSHFEGFHYRTSSTSDRWIYGVDAIPCSMILSQPSCTVVNETKFDKSSDSYKSATAQSYVKYGQTSEAVMSLGVASKYADINDKFNNNILSTSKEEYVAWDNYMSTTYGHENTPKFYTMLPFIKI